MKCYLVVMVTNENQCKSGDILQKDTKQYFKDMEKSFKLTTEYD